MKRVDALFQWFERVNGPEWGDVLDAGTGDHSLGWVSSLPARSVTAVTVEAWRMAGLRETAPNARIVLGEWTDPTLLYGESFDQVLVDYVIGAIDGHAPYFQYAYLERLRPHVRGRVYLVGLEPQPRDGSVLDEVCRVRDACILLAGHRCYREYPRAVVGRWLERAGYRVIDAQDFPNRIGARFVNGQLDVAERKLKLFRDERLREAMRGQIAELRERALAQGEVTWGADYVIAADVR
ncbi:MAG: class I SAM-dependent methyltransferase [Myxococcota bacterium]